MRGRQNECDEDIARMDWKDTRHTTATESPPSGIRGEGRQVPPLHPQDQTGRVVDLGAYRSDLQRRAEQGEQSGPDLRLVPSLKERARLIREGKSLSLQEASQRLEEEIALCLRAICEMETQDKRDGRPAMTRRHFGFSGDW